MGKDWAKGLTAAMDPRLARNAAARRGRSHLRRMPLEQDRRLRGGHRTLPLEWSETMAYVVGLMAADGCLWSAHVTCRSTRTIVSSSRPSSRVSVVRTVTER